MSKSNQNHKPPLKPIPLDAKPSKEAIEILAKMYANRATRERANEKKAQAK